MTTMVVPIEHMGRVALEREVAQLRLENQRLDARVYELMGRMTEMVETSLSRRVRAFHLKYGHPVSWTPGEGASQEAVQRRLRLITEEFFELLAACEIWPTHFAVEGERRASDIIMNAVRYDFAGDINLPELVDALADLMYVIEGTAAELGVDMNPVLDAVHAANMQKEMAPGAAKPTKPEGWKPPDVEKILREQGWKGEKSRP